MNRRAAGRPAFFASLPDFDVAAMTSGRRRRRSLAPAGHSRVREIADPCA